MFVGTSLVESAHIWRALGVRAMDLLALPGAPIDAEAIDRDPRGLARRFTEPGLELPNLIYIFGAGFEDRAINSVDPAVRQRNLETLKNVLECCQAAHIRSLLILPGVDQPGLSHAGSLALAAESLNAMDELAHDAGVGLVFEPHVDPILENPREALEFLRHNPALRIGLDYAHFVVQGYPPSDVDPLVPYAGHFHLRQAAEKQLQARWDDGQIDSRR